MALPLLPCEHIRACFEHLQSEVDDQPAMADLVEYVKETWIDSSVWPISSWSVFGKSIRTNNDVEGWHTRMNVDKAQIQSKINKLWQQYEQKEISSSRLLKRLGGIYAPY